jgi:FkbM family methyltransferase
MRTVEKYCLALRHNKYLHQADWVWNSVRPIYDRAVSLLGSGGLERLLNGTDPILVSPKFRCLGETYEPHVWRSLMNEIKPADTFVDVGVFIGLYTVAVAKRVGSAGRVIGFEPDPGNYLAAREHIKLNQVEDRVELIQAAVGVSDEVAWFKPGGDMAHVTSEQSDGACKVECMTLDRIFAGKQVDVLKIDVEGFEERVLEGASGLLKDATRCPRRIYVEVHPYAWPEIGTTSNSLLDLLGNCGYEVGAVDGQAIETIATYGEIVARKSRSERRQSLPL